MNKELLINMPIENTKFPIEILINHVERSFVAAERNESKLSEEILRMEGMSGIKTRHLYNNICDLNDANYLEIGTWKGSSFISAIHKNNINCLAVDNWSEFFNFGFEGDNNIGSKSIFLKNMEVLCDNKNYSFLEKDSFLLEQKDLPFESVDIYLYDGQHDYESHKNAITYFSNFLSKYSIIIIDDWRCDGEWSKVQRGTYDGFEESNLFIHHKVERITEQENGGAYEYWNGVGVFVCEKLD
jgi:hypothetical protein